MRKYTINKKEFKEIVMQKKKSKIEEGKSLDSDDEVDDSDEENNE